MSSSRETFEEYLKSEGFNNEEVKIILAIFGRILSTNNLNFDQWQLGVVISGGGANSLISAIKNVADLKFLWTEILTTDSKICPHEVMTCCSRELIRDPSKSRKRTRRPLKMIITDGRVIKPSDIGKTWTVKSIYNKPSLFDKTNSIRLQPGSKGSWDGESSFAPPLKPSRL